MRWSESIMSYADGMAAINLEMPKRVPRTEYSAESHWDLVKNVTGINVGVHSPEAVRRDASRSFVKAWNYDFIWNVLIHNQVFGDLRTKMGHAEYAAEGSDFDSNISCPFKDPEEVLNFDPWEAYGAQDKKKRISDFENHYRQACDMYIRAN